MSLRLLSLLFLVFLPGASPVDAAPGDEPDERLNVLFIISDDLTADWAYIQYDETAANGIELFDMRTDPGQYTNLAKHPDHAETVQRFQTQLATRLAALRDNDLERPQKRKAGPADKKKRPAAPGKPRVTP